MQFQSFYNRFLLSLEGTKNIYVSFCENIISFCAPRTFRFADYSVTQTRPLVNQAPHTANLSLLYKDTENGWNGQLAASYTGTKLALVSPFKDADQWDKAMFGLDLSAEKQFKNGLSIFLKANNLLNAKRERYLKTVNESNLQYEGQKSDKTIVETYQYGRTFLLGVRYKL